MTTREVPFNKHTGHMESYQPNYSTYTEMRELAPFSATMRIVGMERGQSAARFIAEDIATGIQYPLFMSDMCALLQGVEFPGEWAASKRGANYGVKKVGK